MSSMMTENGTTDTTELAQRLDALEKAQAVQAATEAGAQATQAATLAGAQATQAAAHAGTWSTMTAGSVALVVGMFLGLTIANR
jgi:precorrin-6x reductase